MQAVATALNINISDLHADIKVPKHVRFRASKTFKSREQVLAEALHAYDRYRHLEKVTNNYLKGVNNLDEVHNKAKSITSSREIAYAQAMRQVLKIPTHSTIPQIVNVIESFGIRIISMPYQTDAFGLSFIVEENGVDCPVIIINMSERITVERWIFSAAHELGHLLLHWDGTNQPMFQDADEIAKEESEANNFAAELLMPSEGFKEYWDLYKKMHTNWKRSLLDGVLDVKRRFVVSYQTVLYRLCKTYNMQWEKVLDQFQREYKIRYGADLKRTKEGFGAAYPHAYGPGVVPVTMPSHEPEHLGVSQTKGKPYFPQGRVMQLLINAIKTSAFEVDDVADFMHTTPNAVNYLCQSIREFD